MRKLNWLRVSFKAWRAARRFNRLVGDYDRRIEEARKRHAPVRYLQLAKQSFVHAALRS